MDNYAESREIGKKLIALLESDFGHSEHRLKELLFALLLLAFSDKNEELPRSPSDVLGLLQDARHHYNTPLFTDFDFGLLREFPSQIPLLYRHLRDLRPKLSLDSLGYLYEKLLNQENIKKEGVIYTPPEVVRFVVESCLSNAIENGATLPITILDPACGSGLFPLECLRALHRKFPHTDKTWIVNNCLYGVDKDPKAIQLTLLTLRLELEHEEQLALFEGRERYDFSRNFVVGNSLISPQLVGELDRRSAEELGAIDLGLAFPLINHKGGFDCIVGNPPYGLSRDERLSAQENSLLKQLFEEYRHGKVNKYQLFISRGYDLLREGGEISYIVPNSWLGIESAKNLRQRLITDGALHHLYIYDYSVFPDVSVEAVVFQATKFGKGEKLTVQRVDEGNTIRSGSTLEIPLAESTEENDWRISHNCSTEQLRLMDYFSSSGLALSDESFGFTPMIALQAYAAAKGKPPQTAEQAEAKAFHAREKINESYLPYLEGKDIGRYALNWSGEYLSHGPWLAEPQSLERFTGPRIALREILGARPNILQATLLTEPFLYNKSVLHILVHGDDAENRALALLAVLNSKVTSFQILANGRKSQRRIFPKILCSDLKGVYLPRDFTKFVPELSALCRLRLSNNDMAIEEKIEALILKAYRLKNSQVKTLESLVYENT